MEHRLDFQMYHSLVLYRPSIYLVKQVPKDLSLGQGERERRLLTHFSKHSPFILGFVGQ